MGHCNEDDAYFKMDESEIEQVMFTQDMIEHMQLYDKTL